MKWTRSMTPGKKRNNTKKTTVRSQKRWQSSVFSGETMTIVRVMGTPHVRKALLLGCSMQMFQQLIGINTIL